MRDAELQMCQDALHAVEALLPRGPQVLLHGPGHWGEDSLSCFPRVHDLPWVFGGRGQFVVVEALDVGEGLLHRHHQPVGGKRTARIVTNCLTTEKHILDLVKCLRVVKR